MVRRFASSDSNLLSVSSQRTAGRCEAGSGEAGSASTVSQHTVHLVAHHPLVARQTPSWEQGSSSNSRASSSPYSSNLPQRTHFG